ncbi:MAG: hypothetical protein J1F27_03875 [Prevotellaceae bacterium]|nr:hypothetical protein [Prevotellaceae bacterium]
MKKYICPAIEINEAQMTNMLAESLIISDTTVDGENALTKEDDSWQIWNDEE